jgi:RNA polymerase sigma factor (sigma-70 family)
VVAALDDLPRREAVVMRLRYLEDLSYKECGDRLDLSAERVRQIEGMAMTKLRKRLHVKAG